MVWYAVCIGSFWGGYEFKGFWFIVVFVRLLGLVGWFGVFDGFLLEVFGLFKF